MPLTDTEIRKAKPSEVDYQDYCYKMAGLAEAAMVRIESILNGCVGSV